MIVASLNVKNEIDDDVSASGSNHDRVKRNASKDDLVAFTTESPLVQDRDAESRTKATLAMPVATH